MLCFWGGLAFGSTNATCHYSRGFADAALRGVLVTGMTIAVPVGIFLIVARAVPGERAPAGVFDVWQGYTASNKALTVVSAIVTYDWRIDLCVALALWAIARLAASGALLRVHTGLLVVALGLFTLALAAPSMLGGTAFVDWRFPIMAALSVVTAIRPGLRSSRAEAVASCCLLLLSVARTAWIADIWQARQADVVAVEHALAPVPAGASCTSRQAYGHRHRVGATRPLSSRTTPFLLALSGSCCPMAECIRADIVHRPGQATASCVGAVELHVCAGGGTRTHFPPSVLRTFSVESVFLWLCHRLAKPLLLCTRYKRRPTSHFRRGSAE